MRPELLSALDHRLGVRADRMRIFEYAGDELVEAVLQGESAWYPVLRGVPCFLNGVLRPNLDEFARRHGLPASANGKPASAHQAEQAKTTATFSDKWRRFKNYGLESAHQEFLRGWYCKKLGLASTDELKAFYRDKKMILEIGPGSGFNTRFMAEHSTGTVFAADISEAAYTTYANTRDLPNCHVVQADCTDLPFADATFDFVIADGVLHHTPNTQEAVAAVYRTVRPGGQFFFYVYKQMGAARRFCDEHIREAFTQLTPEECYAACEPLTDLGRALSKLNAKITLTRPIPILGIPAGTHDVQRLFYYNFVKCFWNDAFDYETNNMVNFDWYHPHHAWQHTEAEVEGWLRELGVTDYRFFDANPNGISVLVRRP